MRAYEVLLEGQLMGGTKTVTLVKSGVTGDGAAVRASGSRRLSSATLRSMFNG